MTCYDTAINEACKVHADTLAAIKANRDHLDAADALVKALHGHDVTASARCEADAEGVTVVVFAAIEPADLDMLLDAGGIYHRTVDHHLGDDLRCATYVVRYAGVDVSLVATAPNAAAPVTAQQVAA